MYCRKMYSNYMVLLNLVCNRRVAYFNIKFTIFFTDVRRRPIKPVILGPMKQAQVFSSTTLNPLHAYTFTSFN